jgi:hypothetical protein
LDAILNMIVLIFMSGLLRVLHRYVAITSVTFIIIKGLNI